MAFPANAAQLLLLPGLVYLLVGMIKAGDDYDGDGVMIRVLGAAMLVFGTSVLRAAHLELVQLVLYGNEAHRRLLGPPLAGGSTSVCGFLAVWGVLAATVGLLLVLGILQSSLML